MGAPVLASGASVLALPMVAIAVFFGSGAADSPPAGGMLCTAVSSSVTGQLNGQGAVDLTAAQVENARIILGAARSLGMPRRATVIGIMTAYQESKLLVLANPTVPESTSHPHQGQGSDRDSIGTFQQHSARRWAGAPSRS